MNARVRPLPIAPSEPSRRRWLGLSLSLLCVIHCVGTAALAPLLPAALSFLMQNEALEWGLLIISAMFAARRCWMVGPPRRRARLAACAAMTGLGVAGLLIDRDRLLQAALGALAILQVSVLVGRAPRCAPPQERGRA